MVDDAAEDAFKIEPPSTKEKKEITLPAGAFSFSWIQLGTISSTGTVIFNTETRVTAYGSIMINAAPRVHPGKPLPSGVTVGRFGGARGRPIVKLTEPITAGYAKRSSGDGDPGKVIGYACVFFPPHDLVGPDGNLSEKTTICPCSADGWVHDPLNAEDKANMLRQVIPRLPELLDLLEVVEERGS